MKKILIITSLLIGLLTTISAQKLPVLNQKVLDFCIRNKGKQVDRGECWDLAKHALDSAQAKWKFPYTYGKAYDYKKQTILAGDLIQFENVTFASTYESIMMPQHTAIVAEVKPNNVIVIAHQNFQGNLTVQFTEIDLKNLKKGKLFFYRPE